MFASVLSRSLRRLEPRSLAGVLVSGRLLTVTPASQLPPAREQTRAGICVEFRVYIGSSHSEHGVFPAKTRNLVG